MGDKHVWLLIAEIGLLRVPGPGRGFSCARTRRIVCLSSRPTSASEERLPPNLFGFAAITTQAIANDPERRRGSGHLTSNCGKSRTHRSCRSDILPALSCLRQVTVSLARVYFRMSLESKKRSSVPNIAKFQGAEKTFETARAGYIWLAEQMICSRPDIFSDPSSPEVQAALGRYAKYFARDIETLFHSTPALMN